MGDQFLGIHVPEGQESAPRCPVLTPLDHFAIALDVVQAAGRARTTDAARIAALDLVGSLDRPDLLCVAADLATLLGWVVPRTTCLDLDRFIEAHRFNAAMTDDGEVT